MIWRALIIGFEAFYAGLALRHARKPILDDGAANSQREPPVASYFAFFRHIHNSIASTIFAMRLARMAASAIAKMRASADAYQMI